LNYNIIKSGGSVISDPDSKNHFDRKNTYRLARELHPCSEGCIIVHGTGHVGKPPAVRYGYVNSGILKKEDRSIALTIKSNLRKLNEQVVRTLLSASIPAVPVDLIAFYEETSEQHIQEEFIKSLTGMINNNLVPVFYGDLLPRQDGSFMVISSDHIVLILSKLLHPENVIFLSDVPGVYVEERQPDQLMSPRVIPLLTPGNIEQMQQSGSDNRDVSGGMRKKVAIALEISKYSKRCFIGSGYSKDLLSNYFNMSQVEGTIVKAQ
jgi:isopentenyl phosphate kinase